MVFDNNITSWKYFKELPMKAIDFRFSDSFHPHYIKFLKTDIKLRVPHSNTWWCNNAGMCVIHGLESDSENGVKIFLQNVFPFASLWGKERNEYVVYFLGNDKFQNLSSDLEALY